MNKADSGGLVPAVPRIRGWFSSHDALVFHWFLSNPKENSTASGILEIGTFEGKSAAFISNYLLPHEWFVVCDIFSLKSDELNDLENTKSYPNFGLEVFKDNMEKFAKATPEIVVSDSARLKASDLGEKYRFIHLDGSHLFDHIRKDLDLAIQIIDPNYGLIAIDDFRAAHTPGVSAAIWMEIANKRLVPTVLTETKMYCMIQRDNFKVSEFLDFLVLTKTQFEIEYFLGEQVVRIYGKSDNEIFENFDPNLKSTAKKILKGATPPYLLRVLRRFF
jgi:hypothetical protein